MVSGVFSLPLNDPAAGALEFLGGQENAIVRTLQNIVLDRAGEFSPLVLCGPTGTGKTFLAEGLAEAWRNAAAGRTILRTSGDDFIRRYADACDTDSITDLRDNAAKPGLILIDAVHTIVAKSHASRELCLHLDAWRRLDRAVIVTSLVPPLELGHEGLASRLSSGLVVPLALPAVDTRRHMLAHFARERSLPLSDDVVDLLAERMTGSMTQVPSPRDLQAILLQLETTATLTNCPIDVSLVDSLIRTSNQTVEPRRILTVVARRFGVSPDELRSSSRRQLLVRTRGVVVLLARRLTPESLQSLGKLLGDRDHSTIHHALETTQAEIEIDEQLRAIVQELETELTSVAGSHGKTKRRKRSG